MKLIFGLLLSSILSSCAPDFPQERTAFSVKGHHSETELSCSASGHLRAPIVTVEYRKESGALAAVAFDKNGDRAGDMALTRDESCTLSAAPWGDISSIDHSKYYYLAHTWVSLTKQLAEVCVAGLPDSACGQAVAILEIGSIEKMELGTQRIYVLLDEKAKVTAAYLVPNDVPQQFSNFLDRRFRL
jgi:hypothetical protein